MSHLVVPLPAPLEVDAASAVGILFSCLPGDEITAMMDGVRAELV